jgi:hypothetical protein
MTRSLTEVRQNLFQLADQVVDTGVPVEIERRGVRLRLVRVDAPASGGRLARLRRRQLVTGAALRPDESPAEWTGASVPAVAVPVPPSSPSTPAAKRKTAKRGGKPSA